MQDKLQDPATLTPRRELFIIHNVCVREWAAGFSDRYPVAQWPALELRYLIHPAPAGATSLSKRGNGPQESPQYSQLKQTPKKWETSYINVFQTLGGRHKPWAVVQNKKHLVVEPRRAEAAWGLSDLSAICEGDKDSPNLTKIQSQYPRNSFSPYFLVLKLLRGDSYHPGDFFPKHVPVPLPPTSSLHSSDVFLSPVWAT